MNPNPAIQVQLEWFQTYLKKHGLAANTIKAYLISARLFHNLYKDITVEHLQAYKAWLIRHYAVSTVNTYIHGINQYKSALDSCQGYSDSYKLPCLKKQQLSFLDNVISEQDYEHLRDRLKQDGNLFWYFIVRCLGATGARVSELVQIKAEHIDSGYMDLYSKGGKVRRIYFPELLCREMAKWLRQENITTGFVFSHKSNQPISPRGIEKQLKVLAGKYGISPETVYPHSFRHRFAKNFLKKFNDISLLADLLGHDSIETTRIYLTRTSAEQRELIDQIVTW